VRSGVTRPDALEVAMARLRRMNKNLVGLVLNDITLPSYYSKYYGAERV
jgi:Mrp family chromosome partitioning ATPase